MFTPDQTRAAAEMLRVCRGGGRIGLANWTPASFIGGVFKTIGRHLPPPAGVSSPALWGTRDHLDTLFGNSASAIHIIEKTFAFRYRSPEHFLEIFRTYYGPVLKAFEALDADGISLGSIGPILLGDGASNGDTSEDHFFGWIHLGGISRIVIHDDTSGLEIDHLQYGRVTSAFSTPAGAVPDGSTPAVPLQVRHSNPPMIWLDWSAGCGPSDIDYAVYEGSLGDFGSHVPFVCSTGHSTSYQVYPAPGDTYYLVVPSTGVVEGSYGLDGDGLARPSGSVACREQLFSCP